jgi:hypothetical protein
VWSKSTDNGITWGANTTFITNSQAKPIYAFGIDGSNRWYLVYGWISNLVAVDRLVGVYSDDSGSTWSTATNVPQTRVTSQTCSATNYISGNIIQGANGRMMASVYDEHSDSAKAQTWVIYTDNRGVSWTTNFVSGWGSDGANEGQIVCLGGSNLLNLVRLDEGGALTTNRFFQFHSINNAASWVADDYVSLGISTNAFPSPAAFACYTNTLGVRIVLAWGNRLSQQMEVREVSAERVIHNAMLWNTATVETFTEGSLGSANGGGYASVVNINGNCIISYYQDTSQTVGSIRLLQR